MLVAGEVVGTNVLFEAAAVVVEGGFVQHNTDVQLVKLYVLVAIWWG